MSLPVLLLDVDGPVNAMHPDWGTPACTGTARTAGRSFRIRWSTELVERLCALDRAGLAEVRWCTTWVDDIDEIVRLTGLPGWPVAFSLRESVGFGPRMADDAKLAAALKVVTLERRPLVWVDDDAIPVETSARWQRLATTGVPVLAVRPDPEPGLSAGELDRIEGFLRAHAPAGART